MAQVVRSRLLAGYHRLSPERLTSRLKRAACSQRCATRLSGLRLLFDMLTLTLVLIGRMKLRRRYGCVTLQNRECWPGKRALSSAWAEEQTRSHWSHREETGCESLQPSCKLRWSSLHTATSRGVQWIGKVLVSTERYFLMET